jgi:hypothetical protein
MEVGVYLYWIPLGAGGTGFVRMNGRVYEAVKSRFEHRSPFDLYHTALEVRLADGRFIVETMWPRPDLDGPTRGVVRDGAVFARWLTFTRIFRYEVRCWDDGVLPDAGEAVGGPRSVSDDEETGRRVLAMAESVPCLTWGRKPPGCDEMWNSNSVISWLLARSEVPLGALLAPSGGRAPGWEAGIQIAAAHS